MALTQKEIDEMARATIRGDYGNGTERKQNLGANYDVVQKRVNELSKQSGGASNVKAPSSSNTTKTTTTVSAPKANASTTTTAKVKTVSKSTPQIMSNEQRKNKEKAGLVSASNSTKQTGNATQTTKTTTASTKPVKTQNTGTITVQKLDGSTKKVANGTVTIPSLDKKYKTNATSSKTNTVNTERARKKYEQKIGHTASENILTDEDNEAISMAVSNLGTGKQFEDYLDVFTPTKGLQEKYGMSARELLDMYNKDKERKDNDFANKHKVVGTALASGKNIVQKPILSGATVLADLVNPEISKKSEEMYGNTLRQVTGDVTNLKGGVTRDMGNVGKTAYNMGTGLAENLIPKALGTPFWVATSALNAAGDAMLSAQDRGVNKRKAAGEGLVSGAIDAALNVKGLDAIKGLQSTGSAGKDLLKQMTIGGGEQAITDIAQRVADSIIAGDNSIAKTTFDSYKAQGLDDDTAFLNTVKDIGGEFLTNVGTGALIGGAIGSGRKLLSDVVNPRIPSIFTPENRVDVPVDRIAPENIGYHSGNLSRLNKAETAGRMLDGSRNTGYFGTGHYFVDGAHKSELDNNSNYSALPYSSVDLSRYDNLYKADSDDVASKLHGFSEQFMRYVNGHNDKYYVDKDGNIDSGKKADYVNDLFNDFKQLFPEQNISRNDFDTLLDNYRADEKFNYFDNRGDSSFTRLMKSMGYNGVDTRGTKSSDTSRGIVIYDLDEDSILQSNVNDPNIKSSNMDYRIRNNGESVFRDDIDADIQRKIDAGATREEIEREYRSIFDAESLDNANRELARLNEANTSIRDHINFLERLKNGDEEASRIARNEWKRYGFDELEDFDTYVLEQIYGIDELDSGLDGYKKSLADNEAQIENITSLINEMELNSDAAYSTAKDRVNYRKRAEQSNPIPNPSQLSQPDAVPVRNLPSPELFNEIGDTFNPPRNLDTESPNGKVSKTRTNTMANSGIMTDEELSKYSPENLFTYEEVSEKRSVGEALDMIRRETPQKVASDLLNRKEGLTGVETDALMTLWDSAVRRAQELDAQGYDSKEQWDLANKLFKKVQTEQTRGGQAMQAMAKWSRNTPTGLLAEANRVINNYGKADDSKWQKEFKKYSQKDAKDLDPNFTKLFLNLANQYSALAPDSRQAKEIMAKMGRLVNSQLPSKLSERVVTGLMDNMLGNFRTLITRNAGGNIGFGALEQLKKPIASGVDTLLSKKTGKKTVANLSKDSIAEYLKGFGSGFADEIADIKSGLHTARSGENDLGTAVANNRHVFIDKGSILPDGVWNTITDTKAVKLASKVLDKADSLVHNGLSIGDRPFYEGTYRQTLQEYKDLRKKGAMGSIVQSLSDAEFENYAKTAAKLNALGAVYQDDTVLARGLMDAKNAVSDISKGVLGVDVLSQFSMPFVKTPANLVTRAIEYSPFGLVKNTANTIKEGFQPNSNGKTRFDFNNLDQQRVANETARNILGTGLWAGALGLASAGGLTGAYSDDKDMKEAQKNKGMQEYALAFDDGKKNMDISWIPVLGNNAVAAAATYDAVRKNPQDSVLGTIGTGAKEGLKSLLNQSVFQGMQELFGGNSSYNNEEGIVGNVVDTIKGGVSQAIPSLSRQLGQVIDPYERNVANGDNEYWQNSVLSAIPSERMKMQPKVNTEGEYVLQNQGRPIPSKILENMILPGKVTQITDSTVNDEAMRIFNENGGDKTAFIPKASRKDLGDDVTDEKFTEYSSKFGKANAEIGKGLIQSDVYNKLSDSAKSNLLSDAYSAIKASLKQEYNKDYTSDDAYAKAFTEGGTPALLDKLLTKTEYNYVMESNGRDTKENLDNVGFYLSTLGDLSPEEKAKAFLDVYKGGDPEKLKHGKKKKDGTYEDGAYEYYQKGDWQKVLDEYDIPQYSTQGNASNIEISVEPSKSNKPSANVPTDEVAIKHSQGDYSDQLRGVTESGNQADWVDAEKAIPFLDKNFATSSPEARGEILWNSGTNHSKTLNTVKDTYGMSGVNDYYTYFYEANADGNSKVSKDEAIAYLNTTDLSAKEKNFWYHRLVPTSKKDIW